MTERDFLIPPEHPMDAQASSNFLSYLAPPTYRLSPKDMAKFREVAQKVMQLEQEKREDVAAHEELIADHFRRRREIHTLRQAADDDLQRMRFDAWKECGDLTGNCDAAGYAESIRKQEDLLQFYGDTIDAMDIQGKALQRGLQQLFAHTEGAAFDSLIVQANLSHAELLEKVVPAIGDNDRVTFVSQRTTELRLKAEEAKRRYINAVNDLKEYERNEETARQNRLAVRGVTRAEAVVAYLNKLHETEREEGKE